MAGGKGGRGNCRSGENGNNKQTTIICFISRHLVLCVRLVISELCASMPTPLLPCLHVVAAAEFAARWSLTSICVYDTACWVTNQLSFHPHCWSNDQTNFAVSFRWNVSLLIAIKTPGKTTHLLAALAADVTNRSQRALQPAWEIRLGTMRVKRRRWTQQEWSATAFRKGIPQ